MATLPKRRDIRGIDLEGCNLTEFEELHVSQVRKMVGG